jgi:hypothetical protein
MYEDNLGPMCRLPCGTKETIGSVRRESPNGYFLSNISCFGGKSERNNRFATPIGGRTGTFYSLFVDPAEFGSLGS